MPALGRPIVVAAFVLALAAGSVAGKPGEKGE